MLLILILVRVEFVILICILDLKEISTDRSEFMQQSLRNQLSLKTFIASEYILFVYYQINNLPDEFRLHLIQIKMDTAPFLSSTISGFHD